MHLHDYVRILKRTWALIATIALLCIGVAAARTLSETPQYTATSKAFVSTSSASNIGDVNAGTSYTQQIIKSYADVATSPYVLNAVIARLGLDESANDLAGQIAASSPLDEVVLQVSATDPSPRRAAELANAVTAELRGAVADLGPDDGTAGIVKITQIQAAVAPVNHTTPTIGVNLATGGIIGMILGLIAAFVYEGLNSRFRSIQDVKDATELPVLGQVIYDSDTKRNPLLMLSSGQGFKAEAFRTLRTNLDFLDVGEPVKSFVFTSSVKSEGKSTTVANLAIALAEAGQRVVLVDADLRRPRLGALFGLDGVVGLTDVLIGRSELADAATRLATGNLHLLGAGTIPPNPSELLRSSAMQEVIRSLEERYDVVLVDAPPLLPVSDGAILARRVDGAVLVCAVNRTRRGQLHEAEEKLSQVGARVFGVVGTMVPPAQAQTRGYAGYDYSQKGGEAAKVSRSWRVGASGNRA